MSAPIVFTWMTHIGDFAVPRTAQQHGVCSSLINHKQPFERISCQSSCRYWISNINQAHLIRGATRSRTVIGPVPMPEPGQILWPAVYPVSLATCVNISLLSHACGVTWPLSRRFFKAVPLTPGWLADCEPRLLSSIIQWAFDVWTNYGCKVTQLSYLGFATQRREVKGCKWATAGEMAAMAQHATFTDWAKQEVLCPSCHKTKTITIWLHCFALYILHPTLYITVLYCIVCLYCLYILFVIIVNMRELQDTRISPQD